MSVRGYAKWKPKADAVHWIHAVLSVTEEYRDYWPLSVRQIFYRVVADHGYEKSEAAYGRLTQIISRARRAGMIPWDAVRDGGLGRTVPANYFLGADDFAARIRATANHMKLNRQGGQDVVVELWCEAGGMVPILKGIAEPYSARVNTGGGYDSVTAKHRLAERVRDNARNGRRTVILHVGDFDGSGEDMANVLREDVALMATSQVYTAALEDSEDLSPGDAEWPGWIPATVSLDPKDREAGPWAYGFLEVERVALTGEQVVERGVETAPAKKTDSRTVGFLEHNWEIVEALGTEQISAQLEALTPPDLEALISEALEARLDMNVYAKVLEDEEDVREEVSRRLGDLGR